MAGRTARTYGADDARLAKLEAAVDAAHLPGRTTVADIMTVEVATCSTTDTAERAAQLMWECDCGAIPIVDEVGHPISIVTDRDICMGGYTQGKTLKEIPITTVMSKRLLTISMFASIASAEGIMRRHGVRRLPVVDRLGLLVGVLSIDDIMACAVVADDETLGGDGLSTRAVVATSVAIVHAHRHS